MTGRPEHDPVARGLAEPGVRRAIVRPEIGLDLDDAADPTTGRVVPDEPGADEGAPGVEGRAGQDGPVEDAQNDG